MESHGDEEIPYFAMTIFHKRGLHTNLYGAERSTCRTRISGAERISGLRTRISGMEKIIGAERIAWRTRINAGDVGEDYLEDKD